ncbi:MULTISPECIES: hypothetical protein [unclassified Streptomyces]|uniref:hypothetical protein n=1 Tax=unclassified Streptomyces TaxID=2593676 RepID=UPI0036FC33F6
MNSAFQVETAEIPEGDLDTVAGGLAVHVGVGAGVAAGGVLPQVGELEVGAHVCVDVTV